MFNLDVLSILVILLIIYRTSKVNRLKNVEGLYTCISSFVIFLVLDILYNIFSNDIAAQFYTRITGLESLLVSTWSIFKWDYNVYLSESKKGSNIKKRLFDIPIILYSLEYLSILAYSMIEVVKKGELVNSLSIRGVRPDSWYMYSTLFVLYFYLFLSGWIKKSSTVSLNGAVVSRSLLIIEYPGIPFVCSLMSLYLDFNIVSVGIMISAIVLYMGGMESIVSLDSLTGVNNRGSFLGYIQNQMKLYNEGKSSNLYLLMLDLDKFKKINDKFGHVEGDNALRIASSILKDGCKYLNLLNGVQISRFGGDEFCVVFSNIKDVSKIESYIRYVYANLEKENRHLRYHLGVSIGVSCYEKGQSLERFIEKSDKCLYQVKEDHHSKL